MPSLQSQVLPDEGGFFFTFHTDLVSEGRTYLVKIMRQLMPDNNLTNIYMECWLTWHVRDTWGFIMGQLNTVIVKNYD